MINRAKVWFTLQLLFVLGFFLFCIVLGSQAATITFSNGDTKPVVFAMQETGVGTIYMAVPANGGTGMLNYRPMTGGQLLLAVYDTAFTELSGGNYMGEHPSEDLAGSFFWSGTQPYGEVHAVTASAGATADAWTPHLVALGILLVILASIKLAHDYANR